MNRIAYIFLSLIALPLFAQESAPAEPVGLLAPDTTLSQPIEIEQDSELDTIVYYEAALIDNDLHARKSYLIGNASVRYKDITLKAGKITLDWDSHIIIAERVADTTWIAADSAGTDSTLRINWIGEPELQEGGTTMTGVRMEYNYTTEKGRVLQGRSEVEGGKYVGQQIKRVGSNTYNVSHSTYTTCDLDSNPHFHFEARRMKMIPNDKVIAKPIIARLGHIPVFILPFAVFPHQSGRHSGLVIPRYGESVQEGRFLRELGYYWAPNDYFDAKGMVDFFEKSGFLFRAGANYAVRYSMNGRVNGSLTRKDYRGGGKERRWDLTFNHSQELSPTSRISAEGTFVSDKDFYKSYSTNLNTRLNRELRSNVTYSKSWPKPKLSLSVNLSHSHDLQQDLQNYTLPQFSFRRGQSPIFAAKKKSRETRWYHSLYFSYNGNLMNSAREQYTTVPRDTAYLDENGEWVHETVDDRIKKWEESRSLAHDINLSMTSPKKYFGWLSLNQGLAFSEDWFVETYDYYYDSEKNRIESQDVGGFAARHSFSYSASANTKAYGVFPVRLGDINSFRHVMTPSVSLSWAPDFTQQGWGYYQYIDTPTGVVKKDRFGSGTPGVGGGNVGFSLRNLFQMRKGEGKDAKKIDLFNIDLSTSYNLKATQKLSDLRSSWTANPTRNMSLSASTSHSFYQYGVDKMVWESGHLPRLTNVRFNFRIRLQGKADGASRSDRRDSRLAQSYEEQQLMERGEDDLNILEDHLLEGEDRFESERAIRSLTIPWRMNVAFNFDLNRNNPANPTRRYYMDISGAEVGLTRNWRIGYSAHYDLAEMEISNHRFTIYRDLHCWEAHIDWVPTGPGRRVYVKVSIKAPMFKDIKVEKRGGQESVLGY
ncbi:LPS-assembly protein LptD [candidate division KSB1 bacterium]|nr:LPS-assembly protein LptD [candidate division KSB1 bacterium]RQW02378.1 MAG: LPS-assembly protein LptD [candidate division KSB1 bacterium]